jgi:hypothetical protein
MRLAMRLAMRLTSKLQVACLGLVAVALAGCFDSIIDGPCLPGYSYVAGECIARDTPDAGSDPIGDAAMPDGGPSVHDPGLVCEATQAACDGTCVDTATDAAHCGSCGRICPSGICEHGKCLGELPGHVIVIGHDYRQHHAAMRRVLGNAISLATTSDVAIARWRGTASVAAHAGTTTAISQAMTQLGRAWHAVPITSEPSLEGVDVLIVEAQLGSGDAAHSSGVAWAPEIASLLARNGVVIVLEGASGASYRFVDGAELGPLPAPTDVTQSHAFVVDPGSAIAQQVLSPYLAATSSVVFEGETGPIGTLAGPIVVHRSRY